MQFTKVATKKIIYPLIDAIAGKSTMRYFDSYKESQWWSYQKLMYAQDKKIRQMIKHLYSNVPYYRRIFKEKNLGPENIKNSEDLTKIPVLTHENVRQNLDDLIANNMSKTSLFRCQTGGTTGHPLVLYKDKNELSSAEACLYRGWEWSGYQIGEKRALLWGTHLTTSKYASFKEELKRIFTRSIFIGAWNLSEEKIKNSLRKMNTMKPTFLIGYTSSIYTFAKFINHEDIDLKFRLTGILTTAEPIFDFQRDAIEKAFNCQVFDQYGCGEVNSMGFECEEHKGLHIPTERIHIEFLDLEDYSPVSDGEMGRIVVTCLENYGMPIIRYDTEDLGRKKQESCSCGRNLPLMNSIVGRTIDTITLPNGHAIFGGFFVYALQDIEWIKKYGIIQFQVVQKKKDYIIFKIHSQKEPSQQALESFEGLMKRHLGDVVFNVEFVDQIPVSASGKRRYIISEVNPCTSQE